MFVYLIILLHFICLYTAYYQKPLLNTQNIWSQRCNKNEHMLNDCNWCRCTAGQFECKSRLCEEIDMFGHFKDTIQELDVGMEGHGAWRSSPTACTPGVQYQRGKVQCICDEDGRWPNPVCRDLFRILHSVEVTEQTEPSTSQTCVPLKLYLVACNVCFCPSTGRLDATLCTNKTCLEGDPVLDKDEDSAKDLRALSKESEIYAICDPRKKYSIGQQKCKCYQNNLLVCEAQDSKEEKVTKYCPANVGKGVFRVDCNQCRCQNGRNMICTTKQCSQVETSLCTDFNIGETIDVDCNSCKCVSPTRMDCTPLKCLDKPKNEDQEKSLCAGKIGSMISIDCNRCKCMDIDSMYCTAKKCLPKDSFDLRPYGLKGEQKLRGRMVDPPVEDQDCIPGTSYKRDCNMCYCRMKRGTKIIVCTVKPCQGSLQDLIKDCVPGTSYETDCYICSCENVNGVKYQVCRANSKCMTSLVLKENRSESLDSLHGYCEPLHVYQVGCNTCRCLSDGKVVACTAKYCPTRSSEPIVVDIVPLRQAKNAPCPKGHSYKVGCNMCVCMSNGNALCTAVDCSTYTVEEE